MEDEKFEQLMRTMNSIMDDLSLEKAASRGAKFSVEDTVLIDASNIGDKGRVYVKAKICKAEIKKNELTSVYEYRYCIGFPIGFLHFREKWQGDQLTKYYNDWIWESDLKKKILTESNPDYDTLIAHKAEIIFY